MAFLDRKAHYKVLALSFTCGHSPACNWSLKPGEGSLGQADAQIFV